MQEVVEKRMLNRKEAAAYLGIGHNLLIAWEMEGILLPSAYKGKRRDRLYDKRDLDAFIDNNRNYEG